MLKPPAVLVELQQEPEGCSPPRGWLCTMPAPLEVMSSDVAGLPTPAPGPAVPASVWPLRLSCQESLPPASMGMKAQQEGGCR